MVENLMREEAPLYAQPRRVPGKYVMNKCPGVLNMIFFFFLVFLAFFPVQDYGLMVRRKKDHHFLCLEVAYGVTQERQI